MSENEFVLNGIRFDSSTEYQNAKKELDGIAYISEHNDMSDDKVVLSLYNKFVQKNVFRTRIGYRFLTELQDRLMQSEVIDKSSVAKLPIYDFEKDDDVITSTAKVVEAAPVKVKKVVVEEGNEAKAAPKTNTAAPKATAAPKVATEAKAPAKKSNLHMEYMTKQTKTTVSSNKEDELKKKYGWSLFLNVVFVLVIIAMAYITLNSKHVNILNYEARLQDEYAAWAEELAAKEKELNKLERELNEKLGN